MEVVVKTNPYANQENGKMGVANVTFGDSFKARSMNIIKGKNDELFVSMPSYPTRKVDENERPVFQDYCHPVTKEFREQLYGAILESFKTGQDVKFDTGSGKDTPSVEVTVVPIEGDNSTKALARICMLIISMINQSVVQGNSYVSLYTYCDTYLEKEYNLQKCINSQMVMSTQSSEIYMQREDDSLMIVVGRVECTGTLEGVVYKTEEDKCSSRLRRWQLYGNVLQE